MTRKKIAATINVTYFTHPPTEVNIARVPIIGYEIMYKSHAIVMHRAVRTIDALPHSILLKTWRGIDEVSTNWMAHLVSTGGFMGAVSVEDFNVAAGVLIDCLDRNSLYTDDRFIAANILYTLAKNANFPLSTPLNGNPVDLTVRPPRLRVWVPLYGHRPVDTAHNQYHT